MRYIEARVLRYVEAGVWYIEVWVRYIEAGVKE